MPSTRRSSSRLGCVAAGGVAVGTILLIAATLPSPPHGPRYTAAENATPRSGGTFVFHHEQNVRTLDPAIAYDELSNMAERLIYDQLLDYDYETRLVPGLAEAMPTISPDGLTYRVRLRRGVFFHPMPGLPRGRELVAEDVRYSLERMLSKELASPAFAFYSVIEGAPEFHEGEARSVRGIRVIDERTIEFRLSRPDYTFLNALAMPFAAPIPRENVEHWGEEVRFHPIGTGPFVFEEWERGTIVSFTRNRRYWRRQANPDRMVFLLNVDRGLAALRFRNGDIDAIHRQTTSDFLFFDRAEKWQPFIDRYPRVSTFAVGLNCEMVPFDDVHVRRAVAYAIDREGWSRARAGRLIAGGQVLPPQIAGYDAELPSLQTFDLDKAREELRLAGYPDGLPRPIEIWQTGSDSTARAYSELFQQDMRRIGIQVDIKQVSFAVYLTESGKPRQVQTFFTGWNQDFPDASNFLDLFHSRNIHPENSENRSFYRNSEVDRLLDDARRETDGALRVEMLRRANEIVTAEAPWAVTYYPMTMEIVQPYVRNYQPHAVWSQDYRNVWLDLPRRRIAQALAGPTASRLGAALFPFGGVRRGMR